LDIPCFIADPYRVHVMVENTGMVDTAGLCFCFDCAPVRQQGQKIITLKIKHHGHFKVFR
jgi:hypothetical protein